MSLNATVDRDKSVNAESGDKMKRIRDTKQGQSISVIVVMKGSVHVATIRALWTETKLYLETETTKESSDGRAVQQRTGTFGSRDIVEALDGMTIDGVSLHGYCTETPRTKAILERYTERVAVGDVVLCNAMTDPEFMALGVDFDRWETDKYTVCWEKPGLEKLKSLGYTVIIAL